MMDKFTILAISIIFLSGLYFCARYSSKEGLANMGGTPRCPNILMQKGKRIYLYNSKLAKVPGVNPIEFENLEDYVEFTEWQRGQGITCPVLYLQKTYDAQGESVYKFRHDVNDPQGGLPPNIQDRPGSHKVKSDDSSYDTSGPIETKLVDSTRNDQPYNTNSVPGYDESSYYVGTKTPLDTMDQTEENLLHSGNAMSPNWGGEDYTEELIKKGVYDQNAIPGMGTKQ